eukprot:5592409-Heterocapsa_arctica.AAC.1
MAYRECEDPNNPDNFWQEQALITDFSTGIRRSVIKQQDVLSWVRSIGVSRLACTPDVVSTNVIRERASEWSTSEINAINDK